MKPKKTVKLVVSTKMFTSSKSLKKKDSNDTNLETSKKKGTKKSNVSPKKILKKSPKKSPNLLSKTACPDKEPSKSTAKSTVKSTAKSTVKSTAKSTVKSTAKSTVKSTAKSTVKSTAKSTVKSTAKSTVKSPSKSTVKSPSKSTVKSPLKSVKSPAKTPAKTKTVKATEKRLSSPSYKISLVTDKQKDINWSELGVQRCTGCNFTTNEDNTFAAHTSLCRPYNERKVKSPSTSPNKKNQTTKSDALINFEDTSISNFGRLVGISEKRAVIQEPYLEGSTPAQTVFLFRCYHCRSYFVNIQTLKDHHRVNHGNKNLTVSLVPFTDDEAAEDISKKIIVDGSRIVPQVNQGIETLPAVISACPALTIDSRTESNHGRNITVANFAPPRSANSTVTTLPSTLVSPQTSSKIVSSETATVMNNPLRDVCFQVMPTPGAEVKSIAKPIQKETCSENLASRLQLVSTSGLSSTTNQTTNKMVVLNLIHKYQSVPYNPVQIEIPAGSNLGAQQLYKKQNLNIAKSGGKVIKTSPESVNTPTKIKTILPKSMLMGIHPTPSLMNSPHAPQIQKLGPGPGVKVINTTQKLIQFTDVQSTSTCGITSSLSPTKQKNRKIILFPLTSNASSSSCSLVTQGTTLTATPIGTSINTSAVVTCATMTSPSIATPFSSSFAGPNLQTTMSPVLISPISTNVSSSGPPVWILPSQTTLTSMDSKLTSSSVQKVLSKQPQVLKTIHVASTISPTKITQSSSTNVFMTTQTVTTVTANSPLSASRITSTNRPLQNQMVTITPVSEAVPTPIGKSLLEKVTIVKSNTGKPGTTPEKLPDSTPVKQDKLIEVNSKSPIKKIDNSIDTTSPENKNDSKSVQCILSPNNKRKLADLPESSSTVSPKKKSHISSETSMSKSTNLQSSPSLSTPTSTHTADDFTVALLAKKKVPLSTACTSTIKKSLSKSGAPGAYPLVIVRKSVGSNKFVVHTMVSTNKLFKIQDSNFLKCSLCTNKISINRIKSHLYWHFHVENRDSAKCSADSPCNYCSVIDYVVSTIPKNKQPAKDEATSGQMTQKLPAENVEGKSDNTKSQDTVSAKASNNVDPESLRLKISSTFSLPAKENIEEKKKDSSDPEVEKNDQKQTEEIPVEKQPSPDLTQNTPPRDKEPCTDENASAKNVDVDIEKVDEIENLKKLEKSPNAIVKFYKKESPSQVEKNTIYRGNFYICGFQDCTYSSEGMEEFKKHQENDHHDANGYSCVHCQLECLDSDLLLHHMETHLCGDMFILYRCAFPECNFGTNLMKSFGEHNLEAHSKEPKFSCYYCSAHFEGCAALQKHLRTSLLKYVHCPHCSVRNGMRDTILSHIKTNHPDKPRRIFVTGQMVCEQKQKVINGTIVINSESDCSDIDSDCMIVDDDILDRHLIKQNTANINDLFEKASKQAKVISNGQGVKGDDDCMIIDKNLRIKQNSLGVLNKNSERVLSPRKTNISANDNIMVQDSDPKLTSDLTESAALKTNESIVSKQSGNLAETSVLNSTNSSQEKSISKDSTHLPSTNTDKDSVESEEGSIYLKVKKVTHTYSRQKENRLSLTLGDKETSNEKFLKDGADERDSGALTRFSKRRILIRNSRSRGKVDIGTSGLDAIINPLYLAVDNEVHCRICTFKCVPLMKMHSHILFMHLHVFLYECNLCHKKGSCKVEMTKHCEHHGINKKGFTVLPEPDWEQVLRSCQPTTCKYTNLKSPVTEPTDSKTKLDKTENLLSSKTLKKSLDVLKPVGSPVTSHSSSSSIRISTNEDRNIFSLFSFDLGSEMPCDIENSQNSSLNKSKAKPSFSSKLFSVPKSVKTRIKSVSDRKLQPRTPTPERQGQITVYKEQYMRGLELISISEVSNCKHSNKNLSPATLVRLSKCPNVPLWRLRNWRTARIRTPFGMASKSSLPNPSKKTLEKLKNPKILHKKVLAKKSKLQIKRLRRTRSSYGGHLLRSASKGCYNPRTLRSRLETKKTLLKTPEKSVAQKRPQSLKSPSSSLRTKSTPPANSKPTVSRHLVVSLKKDKPNSKKLLKKASVKAVAKRKNFAISRQRSLKKALTQTARKKSTWTKRRIQLRKNKMRNGRTLKISSSRKTDINKSLPVETIKKNCLFFSCSWCQFRVTDREHFQRHISLHNFFPQGCKMHCPYCSYTTPNALVLEKHIPMHVDKHPYGCRHCGFSAKTKMIVLRHCKRSHPEIPIKLVNRSTSTQKLKPSWPVVSFSPRVRVKKCSIKVDRYTCPKLDKIKHSEKKKSPTRTSVINTK